MHSSTDSITPWSCVSSPLSLLGQLRRDARDGHVSVEQLLDVIDKQQQTVQGLRRENQCLRQRLTQYEPDVSSEASVSKASAATPMPSYSLEAESKRRRRKRRRKKSPGRRPTELKFADAERTEDIYADAVRHQDCQLLSRSTARHRMTSPPCYLVPYGTFR
jgi:hypothetical protein